MISHSKKISTGFGAKLNYLTVTFLPAPFPTLPSGFLASDLTFSYAESVVPTRHKIIQCNKEMGIIFTGAGQKVFLGVPASCFAQTLRLKVWHYRSLKGFWRRKKEKKEKAGLFWLIKAIWPHILTFKVALFDTCAPRASQDRYGQCLNANLLPHRQDTPVPELFPELSPAPASQEMQERESPSPCLQ